MIVNVYIKLHTDYCALALAQVKALYSVLEFLLKLLACYDR